MLALVFFESLGLLGSSVFFSFVTFVPPASSGFRFVASNSLC